jgi:hypothetical protein
MHRRPKTKQRSGYQLPARIIADRFHSSETLAPHPSRAFAAAKLHAAPAELIAVRPSEKS